MSSCRLEHEGTVQQHETCDASTTQGMIEAVPVDGVFLSGRNGAAQQRPHMRKSVSFHGCLCQETLQRHEAARDTAARNTAAATTCPKLKVWFLGG